MGIRARYDVERRPWHEIRVIENFLILILIQLNKRTFSD